MFGGPPTGAPGVGASGVDDGVDEHCVHYYTQPLAVGVVGLALQKL
jgi:hypothetical protein